MNAKQPELTIFQGAPSLHIDNTHMRREEEEAIEDQKRRNAELQIELEKEFADISEDEYEDEANETADNSHYQFRNSNGTSSSAVNYHKDFPLRDDFTSLRNLVDTKSREIEELSALLMTERRKNKSAVDEYEKRLAIFESEKDRALMTRDQVHENLVESKSKLIEINDVNDKLKTKIKTLENENGQLVQEIESTKLMLSDVQTKYNMVEKNVLFNAERNTDLIVKQSQERHNAQMALMQQQIDNLKQKHDELEHDYKNVNIRYREMQKSREAMLIEKSETINQLNRSLEQSQRQCQELLQRPDSIQENKRLQVALQTLEYQKEEMSITIGKLQRKVQEQQSEIETMDSVMSECSKNNQSFAEISSFVNREPLKQVNSSTPATAETKLSRVMDELIKSQNNIRMKREDIKILEKQLCEKDNEIASMKSDENKLLIDLNKYKDEALKLENKLSLLQEEINNSSACDKKEQERLRKEIDTKAGECDDLRGLIDSLKLNEVETNRKLENKEEQLKALTRELNDLVAKMEDRESQNALLDCKKCMEYAEQLEKLEKTCLESQDLNRALQKEIDNLQQQLANALSDVQAMQEKVSLQKVVDKEIEKLHEKAREFENFMRASNQRNSLSPESKESSTHESSPPVTNSQASEESSSEKRSLTESKIRDEMARIFACQIKTLEKNFVEESKKLQSQIIALTRELDAKQVDLSVAYEQLELLKFTIVHEREEFEGILRQKNDGIKEKMEMYQKHVQDLNEQIDLIDGERSLLENLKRQLDEERSLMSRKETETAQKLMKLQQESTKIIEDLSEKYKKAKKTAANYKQYSEDKEKHYRSECDRIKAECADAVKKNQESFKANVREREQEYQEKLKRIEQEYEFKIEILKGMLEKSQKP